MLFRYLFSSACASSFLDGVFSAVRWPILIGWFSYGGRVPATRWDVPVDGRLCLTKGLLANTTCIFWARRNYFHNGGWNSSIPIKKIPSVIFRISKYPRKYSSDWNPHPELNFKLFDQFSAPNDSLEHIFYKIWRYIVFRVSMLIWGKSYLT